MSAPDLTPEDTAAMRANGKDFREYLRSEMNRGRARAQQAAKKPPPAPPPAGHRPGAWPPGTSPPSPQPEVSPAEVARAVQEYRDWVTAGHPRITTHCECPACQQLTGGTR